MSSFADNVLNVVLKQPQMKEKLSEHLVEFLYLLLTREQKNGLSVFYHKPNGITNEHVAVIANALIKIFERFDTLFFADIHPGGLQVPLYTACGWTLEDVNELQAHIPEGFREPFQTEREIKKYGHARRGPLVLRTYSKFWADIFNYEVGICFKEEIRSAHTQIIGATRAGKTTLLEQLIAQDVRSGASVIVMDSSMDFIDNLKYSSLIPAEKLRIIDPRDSVYHPLSLNMFDAGFEDISDLSKEKRLEFMNNVIGMLTFLFKSMMGEELTGHMGGFLRYCCQLMIRVPGATVETLLDLLENGTEEYQEYIDEMSDVAQSFFRVGFPGQGPGKPKDELGVTRRAIHRRLLWLLDNEVFRSYFTSPTNEFDISEVMDGGKVLLISTDRPLLERDGMAFMGRYFISLMEQATMRRLLEPKSGRRPVYVYIDEAGDYFKEESQVLEDLMDKARKCNVGLTLTHHAQDQLDTGVASAIRRSAVVRMAGSPDPAEINTLKNQLQIDRIPNQPGEFAVFVKGSDRGFIARSKLGVIESEGRRTEEEMENVIQESRAKYSVSKAAGERKSPNPRKKLKKYDEPNDTPHDPLAPLD